MKSTMILLITICLCGCLVACGAEERKGYPDTDNFEIEETEENTEVKYQIYKEEEVIESTPTDISNEVIEIASSSDTESEIYKIEIKRFNEDIRLYTYKFNSNEGLLREYTADDMYEKEININIAELEDILKEIEEFTSNEEVSEGYSLTIECSSKTISCIYSLENIPDFHSKLLNILNIQED